MPETQVRQLGLTAKQLAAFCALFGIDPDTGQQTWPGVDQEMFGGAAGGGKTWLDAVAALWFAQTYPGSKVGLFRRTLPELEETLQAEVLGMLPEGAGKFNERKHTLTLNNGSQLFFCFCDTETDVYKHQGKEFHLLIFDEMTHFSETQVRYLLSRWRVAKKGIPRKFLGSTNPGNIGHEWVKRWWIDGRQPFQSWVEPTENVSRVFIPARIEDNPHLMENDPDYERRLLAMGGNLAKALRYGEWDLHEGSFFAAFMRHTHVIEPFQPPAHYRKWRSVDWGGTDPSVCLWLCSEPETGRIYVYRELRERGLTTTEFKERIVSMTGDETIDYTVADYSGRAKSHDTNLSMFDIFGQQPYAITLQPANKARVEGWRRVRDLLRDLPPDEDGEEPKPALQVMQHCVHTIKELGAAITHPSNNEDVADPTKDDDRRDDCLVGWTRIWSKRGLLPLYDIRAGDEVLTRGGWRRVRRQWLAAKNAACVRVNFTDGRGAAGALVGTPDHRIWVEGCGWTTLNALRYGDILVTPTEVLPCLDRPNALSSMGSSFAATLTRLGASIGATTRLVGATAKQAWDTYIKRFGRLITGRSLMGTTSIIGMETLSTMPSITWNASLNLSTAPFMRGSSPTNGVRSYESVLTEYGRSLLIGIAPTKAERGISSTHGQSGRTYKPLSVTVSSAAGDTVLWSIDKMSASAPTPASPAGAALSDLTTKTGGVSTAELFSGPIATNLNGFARVYVVSVTDAGHHPVYDLTVDDDAFPEFFGEGVLVHNCLDALRYAVMSRNSLLRALPGRPTQRPPRIWNQLAGRGR